MRRDLIHFMSSSFTKLISLLGLAAALITAPLVYAHGDHSAGGNTPEARANRLEERLGLSEEQAKNVEALFTEEAAAIKAVRDKKGNPKAQREEIKTVRAEYQAKLVTLLTPEQAAKLEAQRKARQQARDNADEAK